MVVADFGNAPIDIMSTERSMHAIRSFVRSAAEVKIDSGENVILPQNSRIRRLTNHLHNFSEKLIDLCYMHQVNMRRFHRDGLDAVPQRARGARAACHHRLTDRHKYPCFD